MSIKYISVSPIPLLKLETKIQESQEDLGQLCEAAKSDGPHFCPIYVMYFKVSYSLNCENWTSPKSFETTKAALWAADFEKAEV